METPPTLPLPPDLRYQLEPFDGRRTPFGVLDALLKRPGRILHSLMEPGGGLVIALLAGIAVICLLGYGVVMGSLSGGTQLWAAPVKLAAGMALSVLICLPSLYIFACLNGADLSLRQTAGVLLAVVCLIAVLLIGFAPVAWVFSQSTDSVVFMGYLHLIFWIIGTCFGLRMLTAMSQGAEGRGHVRAWALIFIVVCLQMSTALRPLIGTADTLLPTEKRFFLVHWLEVMSK